MTLLQALAALEEAVNELASNVQPERDPSYLGLIERTHLGVLRSEVEWWKGWLT